MTTEQVLDPDAFQKLYPVEYYEKHLASGKRPDKRVPTECRTPSIACGTISTADASASVNLGATFVLAGIKIESCMPSEDASDSGELLVQVEVTSLSSAEAASGRTADISGPITHIVSSLLNNRHVIDLKQLCIKESQACWRVHLDIYVLDDDGGLLDACLMAAICALSTLKVPVVELDDKSGELMPTMEGGVPVTKGVKLLCHPLALTLGIYKEQLIYDLTRLEDGFLNCTLSIVMDENGKLHGVHKYGGTAEVSSSTMQIVSKRAKARHAELMKLLPH